MICTLNFGPHQVLLDRVLGLEYSPSQDKLFVLSTRSPVSSSSVALCVFDVAQNIDQLFDASQYYTQDESGNRVKVRSSLVIVSSSCRHRVVIVSSSCRHRVVIMSSSCRHRVVIVSSSCCNCVVVVSSY